MKTLMAPSQKSHGLPKAAAMNSVYLFIPQAYVPRTQRGIALFFALVLLLVMTLLGLAVVQVATLQERMAGNYRTQNLAFQDAESVLAVKETAIKEAINSGKAFIADIENCGNQDVQTWAEEMTPTTAADEGGTEANITTKRLDRCAFMPGFAGKKMGQKRNEETNTVYQITVAGTDDPDNPDDSVAVSVIDSIYIP